MNRTTAARSTLALAATAVLAVSGCTDQVSEGKAEHRSFAFKGRSLTVVTDSKLELVPGGSGGGSADVTRWFKASKVAGTAKTSWTLEGGSTLRLSSKCSGFVVDCSLRHRVKVPRDVAVTVRAQDGRVIVGGGFRAPLSVRTREGNINVSGLSAPLTLKTRDGNVRAERLRSRSVRATTAEGYQLIGFSEAPSSVRTANRDGRTTVTVPKAPKTAYQVGTRTRDGSAKVAVPRAGEAGHRIDATTRDGRIALRTR
ncbi:DUF4097 family beta strand repeat-containing protein [Streptomyces boncukensis]|uniref:DUF4097 domain-containing protein n=1 Tax=Streptomyces boncukensis TaxID=2711219 RepID=A0A6G4X3H4_9ACTN|nr:DUF4097 family beta strand repeat-containing protein [Streptomyces boncukensis]NGO71294.1 hypothetical protein [Streptomyces boncukensis]